MADKDVPTDRRGLMITNGSGGVQKGEDRGSGIEMAQRFMSILCPTNDARRLLSEAQDMLPCVGQLTVILAEPDMDSAELQSAFDLFRMPESWSLLFSSAQKVRGDALGTGISAIRRRRWSARPFGWYRWGGLQLWPSCRHISRQAPIPDKDSMTLSLDNFDEIRRLKAEIAEGDEGSLLPVSRWVCPGTWGNS